MGKINPAGLAPFNSPYELGIRMVYMLSSLFPNGADLQKLILLDYAAIYSEDFGGPNSLHTPVPFRNAELYGRRNLVQTGLYLMSTKGLVDVKLDEDGITYYAGENSRALVGSIGSSYSLNLALRCEWVVSRYGSIDTIELTNIFHELGRRWEAEIDGFARGMES
ncbi:ABC-three component system middle component 2 [Pseudomonas sp. PL-6]